jgi:16S rRNA (cytosine1402-N4)-methyltransferase
MMNHIPVLLDKALEVLAVAPGKFIIDGTVDGGGHGLEIVRRLGPSPSRSGLRHREGGPEGIFLGVDRDQELLTKLKSRMAEKNIERSGAKIILEHGSYAKLPEMLTAHELPKADGILLDLGFSSEQLGLGRGFSFNSLVGEEPLDMRYDMRSGITAAEVVNRYQEKELADIFYRYGEERFSRRIAKKIVAARKQKRILTTGDLVEVVLRAVPRSYERGRINPATRIFQALRIYVNDELGELEKTLNRLGEIIVPGGRVAIISFHSLEDRLVKNSFKKAERDGILKIITKKPIVPDDREIAQNPRSRSAKLRAAELI